MLWFVQKLCKVESKAVGLQKLVPRDNSGLNLVMGYRLSRALEIHLGFLESSFDLFLSLCPVILE